jgi:type I thyroxine 5'-deiodinase
VAFYVVYIEEAHPIDGWQMPNNIRDNVLVASPDSLEDRNAAAHACVVKLGLHIPALVDDMHDSVERAYTGWPDRLYVINQSGRVAYKSKAGPFGFHPDEMAQALAKLVPSANPVKQTRVGNSLR